MGGPGRLVLGTTAAARAKMALTIGEAVWDRFPGMLLVVAAARDVENQARRPAIAEELARIAARLPVTWGYGDAASHPHVAAWRSALANAGVAKKFPSAIESLARRVLAGKPLAHINPVVDFYNTVSLTHVVPVGGWDLDGVAGGDIHLRVTAGGERFRELGSDATAIAGPGEISYADDEELITRHFVWRQSEKAKISGATRRLFLISEILAEVGPAVADEVRSAFAAGLERHFAAKAVTEILDARHRRWNWPSGL